jgi:hypothetical protein
MFYVSGFLYSPNSQQILLQQETKTTPSWKLISGSSIKNESSQEAFKRTIHELLTIQLTQEIMPVYYYFHTGLKKLNHVVYSEVNSETISQASGFSWFTMKQILKLPMDEFTKQDLIVAQRVINLKQRDTDEALYQAQTKQN